MEFYVLGPVRLRLSGEAVTLSGRLQRTLLGLLLARANRPVSVDLLTETLWGDAPNDRAEQRLQVHVHRLRRALADPERLTLGPGGYRLDVRPGELDAERFDALVSEAAGLAGREPDRRVELIREALALWEGEPYDGLDAPALVGEARRLTDRRLAAVEELYEAELAAGRDSVLVADLTGLVREHPLRERLRALQMAALYRSGRQSEALQAYQDARQTLVEELGLEPGAELRSVEQQILAGEPVDLGEPAPARSVPAQLPVMAGGFVGRDSELSSLQAMVDGRADSVPVAVLAGTAGVGKTTLAVRWAHQVRDRFPDGQLYVNLRGYGPETPMRPDEVLAGFLRAFGVEGTAIPPDLDERAARFRSLLDGQRVLLLLDNAQTVEQVRPLLPGTTSCFVVITSRDALTGLGVREGAHRVDLDRLSEDEARLLLANLLGDPATGDPDATARLIEQCVRLPLALRIAADLVRSRPARGVAGLVDELADQRGRLDLLDIDDNQLAVRAVFSWSYRQLAPDAARVFRMCGLHPGHDFDAYALAALANLELRVVRRSLDTLVRAHLLDESRAGRFRPHDLLRAYAKELTESEESATERKSALIRLADYYLTAMCAATDLVAPRLAKRQPQVVTEGPLSSPAFADHRQAVTWLHTERHNLLGAAKHGTLVHSVQVPTVLANYLHHVGGYYDEALDLYTHAMAEARHHGDREAEEKFLKLLGNATFDLGRFDESMSYFQASLERSVESQNMFGQGLALNGLAGVCHATGRYQAAIEYLTRALVLEREYGSRIGEVSLLANLSRMSELFDRGDEALRHAQEALVIAEDHDARIGQVNALESLARAYASLGRVDEAKAAAERLSGLVGDGLRAFEGVALEVLGVVHGRAGDDAESARYFGKSLEFARDVGDAQEVAAALVGQARARLRLGDVEAASEGFDAALTAAVEVGMPYEEARAQVGLGDCRTELGDPDRAREHWRHALDIFGRLELPDARDVEARLATLD